MTFISKAALKLIMDFILSNSPFKTIMKKKYILLICSCLIAIYGHSQSKELSIQVKKKDSFTALEYANIFISPCSCGGTTDQDGAFKINLEENEYRIITSMIGFENDTTTVFLKEKKSIEVQLIPTGYQLEDVIITAEQNKENINRTIMGVQQLSSEEMKLLPTAIGEVDVLSSLTMLAGVGSAGEASNGLSVRGGSLDQNLVLMDYAPIFNPTHLFGLFSIFTPEAVGSVDIYRSNMPAKYGGRISSVVDVKVKDPNAEQLNLSGGIGFASTRLSAEAPIIKNKLTILASTRFFYNDFLFSAIDKLKNTKANFIDGTIKLKYLANEKNTFFLTGFYSHDFYQLDFSSKINSITATSNQYDYATINGTLTWLHTTKNNATIRTTLVNSDYSPKILFPQEGVDNTITYQSSIKYRDLQSELSKTINDRWNYSVGLQASQTLLSPGTLLPGTAQGIEAVELAKESGLELSSFANAKWTPSEKVSLSLGLRYTHFLLLGAYEEAQYEGLEFENILGTNSFPKGAIVKTYGGLEPRFGARWKISTHTSLKGSYSLTRQYLQNIYNSTTPLPTSRWKTSDRYIAPQIGHTYSLGIYQNLKNDKITTNLEGYYRTIKNVLAFKSGADFFLEQFIEKDIVQGVGRTYGLEFSLAKPKGKLNGWFNYTWSRSLRKFTAIALKNRINNNEWFNSDFDRPHVFNGTINMKYNEFNTFSFNFVYQTGRPYTVPNAIFEVNNVAVPIYLARNNARLPDYHRLDFSWRIHNITTKKTNRWKADWILTLYNLYGRDNGYNRFFKANQAVGLSGLSQGALGAYQVSIFNSPLVSLTYSFKFK